MEGKSVDLPSSPPSCLSSHLVDALADLIKEMKRTPNPFLLKDLCEYLKSCRNKQKEPLRDYYPVWFQQKYKHIFSNLPKLRPDQQIFYKYLDQLLKSFKIKTYAFWHPASLFLDLKVIKSIEGKHYDNLIQAMQKSSEMKELKKFLQNLSDNKVISLKQLEKQISIQKKKDGLNTLSTLLSQIIKKRPQIGSFMEEIMKNRDNLDKIENQVLEISSSNFKDRVVGKITKSSFDNNVFSLTLQGKKSQTSVEMQYNPEKQYISQITFQIISKKSLKEALQLNNINRMNQNFQATILKQAVLEQNSRHLSQSSFIPPQKYDIKITLFQDSHNYELHFLANNYTLKCFYCEVIYDEEADLHTVIIDKAGKKIYNVQQFFKGYFVQVKTNVSLSYNSREQNNRYIKLKTASKTEEIDFIEILDEIHEKKAKIIGKLISLESQKFEKILKKFIQNESLQDQIWQQDDLSEGINQILTLYQQINQKITKQTLMNQILSNANYTTLVNKEQTLNSIKTIELLAESERFTESMKGRYLIAFYGTTGSGKSTSVNYFLRLPLQYKEDSGKRIVQIDEENLKQRDQIRKNDCKIGHSAVLSETLYSRGYCIPLEELEEDEEYLKTVVLCDHPGFGDTRGSQYEICANLSMDRTIEVCKALRAIVLVVPFDSITADRSSKFIQLISSLRQKFPNLLDPSTSIFQRFFILVTKCQVRSANKDNLRQTFLKAHEQFRKRTRQVQTNDLEMKIFDDKKQMYESLVQMCDDNRIDFIDIEDEVERNQILMKYAKTCDQIRKEDYKEAISNNWIIKNFTTEISVSIHTWLKFILEPFLSKIPKKINKIRKSMDKIYQNISYTIEQLNSLEYTLIENGDEARRAKSDRSFCYSQIERIQEQNLYEDEIELIESEDEIISLISAYDKYEQKIKGLEKNIEYQEQIIMRNTNNIKIEINQLEMKQQEKQNLKQAWKQQDKNRIELRKGFFEDDIVDKYYRIGEVIKVGGKGFSKTERLEFLERGETLPKSGIYKDFTIGTKDSLFCSIIKVSKRYKLLSTIEFDPKQYIQQNNLKIGEYQATISSNRYELQAVKLFNEGKIFLLSVLIEFPQTKDTQHLPFLKITHKIPNIEHNIDAIRNMQAELTELITGLHRLRDQIKISNLKISSWKKENTRSNKTISKIRQQLMNTRLQHKDAEQRRMKEISAKTRANKINEIKQQKIKDLKESQDYLKRCNLKTKQIEENISKKNKEVLSFNEELENEQRKLAEVYFQYQRMAFLIKDQMAKQIPQSLKEFIKIAISKRSPLLEKEGLDPKNKAAAQDRRKNFEQFLKIFTSAEDTLPTRIDQILAGQF